LWGAKSESQSYVTTDGQSASLSWNKAPIWDLRPDFCYHRIFAGLLMWGALSDERTGLSFTIAAGPSQRSHSQVRAPWDSRPYFTVSDLRLAFSSPPTTRRVTVEVFDPASTRVSGALLLLRLLYICLAYRIGDTESNSSAIHCHENDTSVVQETSVYVVVKTMLIEPLLNNRLFQLVVSDT
jgi:hypothetical protein